VAKTIWKFTIQLVDKQVISVPKGTVIRHVAEQNGLVCLWGEVDPDTKVYDDRTVCIYGTGHPLPDNPGEYIGSVMIRNGTLVFHIYEDTGDV
jgi:hypothetical protein